MKKTTMSKINKKFFKSFRQKKSDFKIIAIMIVSILAGLLFLMLIVRVFYAFRPK